MGQLAILSLICFVGSLFGLLFETLELGGRLLDGVGVRAIRQQVEEMCALAAVSVARPCICEN